MQKYEPSRQSRARKRGWNVQSGVPWRLIKSLSRKKERQKTGLTVAEGPSVLLSAIESQVELQAIILSEEFSNSSKGQEIRNAAFNHISGCRLFVVPETLYKRMSDTTTPQGAMCLLRFPFRFPKGEPGKTWGESLDIVGVDIQDPGNVGTLIRTGAFSGASSVVICGHSSDPFSPKTLRSSAGAAFKTKVTYMEDCLEFLRRTRALGRTLFKAVPRGGLMPWEADFRCSGAIVLGNEARGLGPEILELPGKFVTIPMPGGAESLNVAMASSILAYEAVKQRSNRN